MRGTKLNMDSYFSRAIHIHNFPTILLAGSLERKNNTRAGRTKKKSGAKTVLRQSCHRISITMHLEII
jgi:hypothetical protein